MTERKESGMGNVRGRRLGDAIVGKSESDEGEATLSQAFDAVAMIAVLSRIAEEGGEAAEQANAALAALESGDPEGPELARVASQNNLGLGADPDAYRLKYDVSISIETRPHNQWVRVYTVKATPSG
jgi:hypothetical protein